MANNMPHQIINLLKKELTQYQNRAIAVSGGIDSLTLATLSSHVSHSSCEIFHAVSPAVPPEATNRVRALAKKMGWNLKVIDAREFEDERYLANPINRCFYCKDALYNAISTIAKQTSSQIMSGTNIDDLAEYRPGINAANRLGVIHPFAKLGINKLSIRTMAHALGLGDLANLPSSPCLSSRIETGIPIRSETLALVHSIESLVTVVLKPLIVRCRIRPSLVVIELDQRCYQELKNKNSLQENLTNQIQQLLGQVDFQQAINFALYLTGSAFIGNKIASA